LFELRDSNEEKSLRVSKTLIFIIDASANPAGVSWGSPERLDPERLLKGREAYLY
jgi:hypothetical protein